MPGPPRRYGMLQPPPPAVAATKAPSFRDVGWLLLAPQETTTPALVAIEAMQGGTQRSGYREYKVARRDPYLYSDPPDTPMGLTLFRRQAIVSKVPTQYGTDDFANGHYAPFAVPIPIRSTAPFVESSGFQPLSRGGHVLVSITESNAEGGPGAAARRFANTRFGLWFKAWVIGGANIRPLGSVQTPSPQFRGVFANYGYQTLPQVIGQ